VNFSIIIPVKELNTYLEESVPILLELDYARFEIIILPNSAPKRLPSYLRHKRVSIIPSGRVSPAIKRDIGAKRARGEYLAFIDDDAYPRKDWLKVAEVLFKQKKVAALCGPALTPDGSSFMQRVSGLFYETLMGGGGMSYRYRPARHSFYVDDYPTVNFFVKRKVFQELGGFDSTFWPGEDTKFCLDLTKRDHKIWYSNKIIVWHHRRKNILEHLKQVGTYGRHRGFFAKKYPETSRKFTYGMPSLFVVGIVSMLLLMLFWPPTAFILIGILGAYFTVVTFDAFIHAPKFWTGIVAIPVVFLSHIAYGIQFIHGLMSTSFNSKLR
jgi:GT2 family glycosyltransferase